MHACVESASTRAQQRLSGDRWWWNFNVVNTHTRVLLTGQTRRQPRPSLTPMKASSQPRLWSSNSSNRSAHHAHTPSLATPHMYSAEGESRPAKAGPPARDVAYRHRTPHTYTLCTAPTLGVVGAESAPTSHCTCQIYLKQVAQSSRLLKLHGVLRVDIYIPCAGGAISHSTQPQHGQSGC